MIRVVLCAKQVDCEGTIHDFRFCQRGESILLQVTLKSLNHHVFHRSLFCGGTDFKLVMQTIREVDGVTRCRFLVFIRSNCVIETLRTFFAFAPIGGVAEISHDSVRL